MADEIQETWDKGAFWYPTLDRTGALLGIGLVLLLIHFETVLGLELNGVIFGWLPTQFAYHLGTTVLYVGYAALLYYYWPYPSEEVLEEDSGG